MTDKYTVEKARLDKLAGAAAIVADEFERTHDEKAAVAAQVLYSLIAAQLQNVNDALDKLIEQSGV